MHAPAFWWRARPTVLARLLQPLGFLYGAIAARRMERDGVRASLPVICVGNFTAGGAGKTPTALAVADTLLSLGETPAFLSRGYGGKLAGPVQVMPHHRAEDVGDEPIVLSRRSIAVVSRERPPGANLAKRCGATIVIMDDGLQNPSLVKDFSIAVVDAATGIGNGLTIPAGPLRAPMAAQWNKVDAVLVIGDGDPGQRVAEAARKNGKQVFFAHLTPDEQIAKNFQGKRVLAFAGIGRPEKFFKTLHECGASVEKTKTFADHRPYTKQDLADLARLAKQHGLELVTTEKDLARIGAMAGTITQSIITLPVRLTLSDEAGWNALFEDVLSRSS